MLSATATSVNSASAATLGQSIASPTPLSIDPRTIVAKWWMGFTTVAKEVEAGNVELIGDPEFAKSMQQWLGLSTFAKEKSRVAA